ncbi:hypothetical protein ULMS_15360 [Patiriisocius marinistellae]|uniref:Uncharacterized protein n=1 Tax=Patiriisocius marinistellae TaxID=2494560 RepID=A0A5J4FXI6_9FLAO|nr:hypothetical protein [Patiriisocius marinistellae]GEQ86028.1 hypothetical protein ULMS_15360 [Patiriisocius marinistellae]
MEPSFYFYAILAALGYILIQSLFMVGVWISAKGETEKMPNGKDYDSEMILFPFKKWVMKSRKEKVIFEGLFFNEFIEKLRVQIPEFDFSISYNEILITKKDSNYVAFVNLLNERIKRIDSKIVVTLSNTGIQFHKDYTFFKVNKYLRKPIIQCPICMSSVWSIFTYWIPVIYWFGFSWPLVYLGIANTCILACVNWLVFSSRPQ